MKRKCHEEFKLSVLKRLTGRQDPSVARIVASIICAILFFLITFFAGFYLNNYLIKPMANVVFHPFIEDNSYLPIEITNGPKPLHDVSIRIKTCYMDSYKVSNVPDLIPTQVFPIHLTDEDTIFALDKVFNDSNFVCNPKNVSTKVQCFIQSYIDDGKLVVPPQECKRFRCGYCPYEMVLSSREFSKTFNGTFPGPVEVDTYKLIITPNHEINSPISEMEPYSPVGVSLFSPYDRCMLETNQNFELCKRYPIEVYYDEPFTFSITPSNQSLGNVSLNITQVR